MQKVHLSLLFLVLLLLVSACSSKEYDTQIQLGKEALKEERYEDAIAAFKKAAEKENTEEIQQYIMITTHTKDSFDLFGQGEFSSAALTSKKITNIKESNEIIDILKPRVLKLQQEAASFDDEYKNASNEMARGKLLLEQNNFDEAHATFKSIAETEAPHPKLEELAQEASDLMNQATEKKEVYLAEQQKKEEEERLLAEQKRKEEQEKANTPSREEVFTFLREAREKQFGQNGPYPSKSAIQDELSSHFTREYSSFFIDEMFWEQGGTWEIIPTDNLIGFVPNFSYNSNTKVQDNGNEIIVSEFFPASEDGPVSWGPHTETVVIAKTANGILITDID